MKSNTRETQIQLWHNISSRRSPNIKKDKSLNMKNKSKCKNGYENSNERVGK